MTQQDKTDIVWRLRANWSYLGREAADEIERLRGDAEVARLRLEAAHAENERLRLTDAEVNAIRLGELACPGLRITDNGKWVDVWAVLRGLLERARDSHTTQETGSNP